jgi:diadenosine tetraphosphatase ApaH/serine/threonine PP2A family protein phosphatase
MSDADVQAQITGCEAELICIGHFHKAMDRIVGGVRIINPGSVSNPSSGTDLRPTYAILHADVAGYTVSFYQVDYDYRTDIEAVKRCGIAGADFINRALTGQLHVGWMDSWDGVTHSPVFQSAKVPD